MTTPHMEIDYSKCEIKLLSHIIVPDRMAASGDVTFCVFCHSILKYTDDLEMRQPDREELDMLFADANFIRLHRRFAFSMSHRPGVPS
jgi:hypothetical protein